MPTRHLLFALILCRHSEFPAFLWLTSLPLRAASSSPHIAVVQPLDLISVSASRESGAVAKVNFHVAEIDLRGSDFTARSAYSARAKKGRSENEREGGGGCAKPLRGQAPVTPNSLILRSFHLATRYKSQDFVERDPREMANLPVSQIFKS